MKNFLFPFKAETFTRFLKKNNSYQESPEKIKIQLYDATNIDQLEWPNPTSSLFTQQFLIPLIQNGINHYIDNLKTDLKLLKVKDLILPLTINENEYENSYVCSPYNFYISYSLKSIDIVKSRVLKQTIKGILYGLAKILQQGKFNKVVQVNNFPFSTNVYPSLDRPIIAAILNYLKTQFPDHAIVFRTLNAFSNQKECQTLKSLGASLLAYRQVYLIDTKDSQLFTGKTLKKGFKHLQKTSYEIVGTDQLKAEDIPAIVKMYEELYIEHHSKLNLKFNAFFIDLLLKNEILHFKALRKEGRIDGIFGYFCYNGLMVSPFVGYDRRSSQGIQLYDLLSSLLIAEAKEHQAVLHMGAGASTFKKNRKAQGYLEYMAVYTKHLALNRKIPWILVKGMINTLGIHYMKKY